jgi:hypothetical protein
MGIEARVGLAIFKSETGEIGWQALPLSIPFLGNHTVRNFPPIRRPGRRGGPPRGRIEWLPD